MTSPSSPGAPDDASCSHPGETTSPTTLEPAPGDRRRTAGGAGHPGHGGGRRLFRVALQPGPQGEAEAGPQRVGRSPELPHRRVRQPVDHRGQRPRLQALQGGQRRHRGPALRHHHGGPHRPQDQDGQAVVVPARPVGAHLRHRRQPTDQHRVQQRSPAPHQHHRAGLRDPHQPLRRGQLRQLPRRGERHRGRAPVLQHPDARQELRPRHRDPRVRHAQRRSGAVVRPVPRARVLRHGPWVAGSTTAPATWAASPASRSSSGP